MFVVFTYQRAIHNLTRRRWLICVTKDTHSEGWPSAIWFRCNRKHASKSQIIFYADVASRPTPPVKTASTHAERMKLLIFDVELTPPPPSTRHVKNNDKVFTIHEYNMYNLIYICRSNTSRWGVCTVQVCNEVKTPNHQLAPVDLFVCNVVLLTRRLRYAFRRVRWYAHQRLILMP